MLQIRLQDKIAHCPSRIVSFFAPIKEHEVVKPTALNNRRRPPRIRNRRKMDVKFAILIR